MSLKDESMKQNKCECKKCNHNSLYDCWDNCDCCVPAGISCLEKRGLNSLSLGEYDTVLHYMAKKYPSHKKEFSRMGTMTACELVFKFARLNPEASLDEIHDAIGELAEKWSKITKEKPLWRWI